MSKTIGYPKRTFPGHLEGTLERRIGLAHEMNPPRPQPAQRTGSLMRHSKHVGDSTSFAWVALTLRWAKTCQRFSRPLDRPNVRPVGTAVGARVRKPPGVEYHTIPHLRRACLFMRTLPTASFRPTFACLQLTWYSTALLLFIATGR